MAMTTTYLTVNGKIRSEQRAGEAHSRDYVLDRLGSVIQIYQNGWPIADACYEPYGGIYTQWNMEGKTFTWLGGWGYRQTGVEWSSVYVRARHYSRGLSNWTSIDPLWPSEMAYGYVEGRVITSVDPSGMQTNSSRGRKLKECSVYFCDVFWPRHRFVCVSILRPDGSSRQCSGGFYPKPKEPVNTNAIFGRGFIGDEPNVVGSCPVEGDRNVKCTPVNRAWNSKQGCDFADKVCKCIDRARKDPGLYQFATNNCYNFSDWVIECACAESGALVGWLGDTCREFFSRGFYRK